MTNYDIIGDVHGQGAKLRGLLKVLGWKQRAGLYEHPDSDRQAIFVGDLVDRGPEQREVLTIVRTMVEAGTARVILGNHEFNAICYATDNPNRPGEFLREQTKKNTEQCEAFLGQLSAREQAEWVAWFRTLPLWLDEEELGGIRVIHACWHAESMQIVREACGGNVLGDDVSVYTRASDPSDPLYAAVEVLLKGPEVELAKYGLPPFLDPSKHVRTNARLRWWWTEDLELKNLIDIRDGALTDTEEPYPDPAGKELDSSDHRFAYTDTTPLVYGHHWREWEPNHGEDWTSTTACVDFSAGKEGPLVAYRWSGESDIDPGRFIRSA